MKQLNGNIAWIVQAGRDTFEMLIVKGGNCSFKGGENLDTEKEKLDY